jgi:predicted nuclease of predicted toxin-antitoxin system
MSEPAAHRFYLDEDVPPAAAIIARAMGLDVVAATEVGPLPRTDPEHIALAAADKRAVVTYNRNDFQRFTKDCFAAGRPHAGVLVVVRSIPRDAAAVAHALQTWCAGRLPLQPYEIQYLSAWPGGVT